MHTEHSVKEDSAGHPVCSEEMEDHLNSMACI